MGHVPAGHRGVSASVFLLVYCRKQFQDHPAEGEPVHLRRHWRRRQHCAGCDLVAKAIAVFVIIGASFGPICGAMLVDYLLCKGEWSGPRAGFNPAGWIAWALGFTVGILPNLGINVPAAPVAAFVVGAVAYFLCAKAGLQSAVIPLPKKS